MESYQGSTGVNRLSANRYACKYIALTSQCRRQDRQTILGLSPSLGLPDAGTSTGGTLAAPRAGSEISSQTALTVGLLAAGRNTDPDASVRRDPSLKVGLTAALGKDVAVADLHPITVLAVAAAALGNDDDTPIAIKGGTCNRRAGSRGGCRREPRAAARHLA